MGIRMKARWILPRPGQVITIGPVSVTVTTVTRESFDLQIKTGTEDSSYTLKKGNGLPFAGGITISAQYRPPQKKALSN